MFWVVDYAAAAREADLELDEIRVILLGNPVFDTLLLQDFRPLALELPLKISVYSEG